MIKSNYSIKNIIKSLDLIFSYADSSNNYLIWYWICIVSLVLDTMRLIILSKTLAWFVYIFEIFISLFLPDCHSSCYYYFYFLFFWKEKGKFGGKNPKMSYETYRACLLNKITKTSFNKRVKDIMNY